MIKTMNDIKLFNTSQLTDIKQLKKAYFQLAKKHHPDNVNGSKESMQTVNNEYDYLLKHFSELTSKQCKADSFGVYDAEFKKVIESLIKLNLQGITIEIVGYFIYVNGITKEMTSHREALKTISWTADNGKQVKFRYNGKQQNWYYSPSWYVKRGKTVWSMEEKRSMYGSDYVSPNQTSDNDYQLGY